MSLPLKLLEVTDYAARETVSGNPLPSSPELIRNDLRPSTVTDIPSFARRAPGFDEASRLAGRLNAAAIAPDEVNALLAERASLLQKKYESSLTKREINRLEYVRWSLDRIDDAKNGFALDRLDSAVSEYEHFLGEVKTLQLQIAKLAER
ncbi:hypothetical protein [Bradyrhizobium sp. SZCCHNS2015]|uniref:hypothetical protein n=1 Tax=Bradyrhizobium sp. SZCCHNS2015 TaxID=3057305 RepID=UPI0028E7EA36|nr:hypothetical protein [Bradyrhizobium sp. SZCCHNS2015]